MEERKKSIFKRWWFWVIIAIVITSALWRGGKPETKVPTKTNNNPTKKAEQASKITYDNFLKINMGAKLKDVTGLLGEGSEQSSSEVGGIKTVMYTWNGPGISNMNVTVQNGAITGKAQAGLQEMDAKVTLEKYNKVKEKMTYAQVKAILGEGQIISQTKIMSIESTIYEWINKDGSNMNGSFTGGKLEMKSQFNLK
ncbi:MAG: DUF3862 domain-containing protein [Bacillota bacterium]|nr:DUF3862 domain-containing protein [Bacillota bacterium]